MKILEKTVFAIIFFTFFGCATNIYAKNDANQSLVNQPDNATKKSISKNKDTLLSSPVVQAGSLLFGFIGVIGTFYTVRAWRIAREDKQVYKFLFDAAKHNIDLNITKETIAKKQKEAESYSKKIVELQENIRHQIPIAARNAVLRAKLHAQIELLTQTYQSIKDLNFQLNGEEPDNMLPAEILNSIESEISPEYIVKEQRSNWKNYITIITTTAAICSTLLPYPFGRFISIPLFLATIPFIIKLYGSYLPSDALTKKQIVYNLYAKFSLIAAVLCCVSIGLMISFRLDFFYYLDRELFLLILIVLFLFSSVMSLVFWRKQNRIKLTNSAQQSHTL